MPQTIEGERGGERVIEGKGKGERGWGGREGGREGFIEWYHILAYVWHALVHVLTQHGQQEAR
jgi:hypothetical protein